MTFTSSMRLQQNCKDGQLNDIAGLFLLQWSLRSRQAKNKQINDYLKKQRTEKESSAFCRPRVEIYLISFLRSAKAVNNFFSSGHSPSCTLWLCSLTQVSNFIVTRAIERKNGIHVFKLYLKLVVKVLFMKLHCVCLATSNIYFGNFQAWQV